jgi:L-ribulose-5-phosphate 3-epimerase
MRPSRPTVSRREVLQNAALALPALGTLAGFAPGAQAAQPARGQSTAGQTEQADVAAHGLRTLRKAAMIGMVGEGETLRDKFALLRDCGFEGVEVDAPSSIARDEFLDAADKSGLVIHGAVNSVHWAKPLNHPSDAVRAEALQGLEACLRDAGAMGCSSILLVPGVVNNDMAYDQCYRVSQEQIRKVLPLAEELGVTIAVENVWNGFLLSPLEAAQYVDEFAHPKLAFHFDIGNVINFGRPDQWVRILGSRIAKLHIKDFSLKKRDGEGLWKGFSVELGEGDAGWPAVMKALDDIGYSNARDQNGKGRWATAEVRGGDRKRLQQVSEQMDRLFAR